MLKEILKDKIAFFVGGCVRDSIIGVESKDIDVEVFDISIDELVDILTPHGKVSTVGKSFGVVKLTTPDGQDFDFSLPRRDSKCGVGHKGFKVVPDSTLTIEEAAARRDFTMNAMSIDVHTGKLVDPFGGESDFKAGILRHTSPAFAEDPLRVLRGFQFCGKFNLSAAPETINFCKQLKDEFHTLPKERVWVEWEKWATKSTKPSAGLRFLKECGWLDHFPEVSALIECEQNPEWHPEGDVFEHTCQVIDAAAGKGLTVVMAALCHDLGKPETTFTDDSGTIRSPGHCQSGVPVSEKFLNRIGAPKALIKKILPLVAEHLVHLQPPTKKTVRRLIVRLGDATVSELIELITADHAGRGSASGQCPPAAEKIKCLADEIGNEVQPIVMGRHLIDRGLKPGPHFKELLSRAFEAQLDGKFNNPTDGIRFLGI
jgi:tRNA nucleotidyltransferase (CCA-adding enzyme)